MVFLALVESGGKLQIGDEAPAFSLMGVDGMVHSISDYRGAEALLVVFMCNHCPYVKAKLAELGRIRQKYKERGLSVVGINSNAPNPDYLDDSFPRMKEFAHEQGISFDYLADETQDVARAYGAVCTPDPFLFDRNFKLAYHGRIDDAHGPDKEPKKHELDTAIARLLEKGVVDFKQKPSMGCSIKWVR